MYRFQVRSNHCKIIISTFKRNFDERWQISPQQICGTRDIRYHWLEIRLAPYQRKHYAVKVFATHITTIPEGRLPLQSDQSGQFGAVCDGVRLWRWQCTHCDVAAAFRHSPSAGSICARSLNAGAHACRRPRSIRRAGLPTSPPRSHGATGTSAT